MSETDSDKAEWNFSDHDVLNILSGKIKDNLCSYFDELDTNKARVIGKLWGGQETARTFRFEVRLNEKNKKYIFVKLCPIFEKLNPALLEYETLQLLYEKMPLMQKDCHVSRPLDYFPDLHAYAMESVGTKNFKPYLLKNNSKLRNNSSLTELFSIVGGCATWLKTFHEITKSEKRIKFTTQSFIDGINEDYDYRSLRKYAFKEETISVLDKLFEKLASLDNRYEMPCAKWHWDYTPGHIFLDNNRISVIDILGLDETPVFEDIGRFLASLSGVNNMPFHPLFDHERASKKLCSIFMENYFLEIDYDRELFYLFTQIYKLKYLIFWFCGQHFRVSSKIHPIVGNVFANLRLVKLFERPLLRTVTEIYNKLIKLT
jgi:hypothetical protein